MALLLSMYQKLRLTRERNQLQLELTQISAKRKRVTKNMSEIKKRYKSIQQNIDNGIKQLKNQYKLWTQNAVLGGAGTFSPSVFGNTGTSGYVINALSNWATNTQVNDNLYTDKAADIVKVIQSGGTFIKKTDDNGQEEKNDDGRVIRRERYQGLCQRSFYVGDAVTEEDIKAKFKDGVLTLMIPKKEKQPEVEQKKYIAIEG